MRLPIAFLAMLLLAGCATNRAPVNTFCLVAKPITWSAKDSDGTIAEVKSHNAVGKELCGWRGR